MNLPLVCIGLITFSSGSAPPPQGEILKLKDGTELRYAISLPKAARKKQPVPLIMALHYAWNGATPPANYGAEFMSLLIEPALGRLGAIIVAPVCPDQSWTVTRSEEAVLELISSLESRYEVERSKVLITGFSLGGYGTWYMAARHPEIFSAAIPMAARPMPEWVEKIDRLPLFVIHSRRDQVVPIGPTEQSMALLKKKGVPVKFLVIDDLGHYDTPGYVEYLAEAVPWVKQVWAGRWRAGRGTGPPGASAMRVCPAGGLSNHQIQVR